MDPNVDKAFHNAEQLQQSASVPLPRRGPGHKNSDSTDPAACRQSHSEIRCCVCENTREQIRSIVTGTLASLLDKFPQDLIFDPEDEKKRKSPSNSLPDEILVLILRSLDTTGIERFCGCKPEKRVFVTLDSGHMEVWSSPSHHTSVQV